MMWSNAYSTAMNPHALSSHGSPRHAKSIMARPRTARTARGPSPANVLMRFPTSHRSLRHRWQHVIGAQPPDLSVSAHKSHATPRNVGAFVPRLHAPLQVVSGRAFAP